jgi:hypothetical protein
MRTQININQLINCNAIEMTDGSKWINWYLDKKKHLTQKKINATVHLLQDIF